jgi:hypothetical protein
MALGLEVLTAMAMTTVGSERVKQSFMQITHRPAQSQHQTAKRIGWPTFLRGRAVRSAASLFKVSL